MGYQIKSNQIKSNQIKSNQIKSNQIKSNRTGTRGTLDGPSATAMNEWRTDDKKIQYCERTLLNYAEVRNGESIFRGILCGLRLDGVCVHVRPVVRFVGSYVIL